MWLAGMPGDSGTVSWPSFLLACSWDWSSHLSESGEWDPPKDLYEGFIPGCLLATAGRLPGRTGLGDEWDPEPKTRGYVGRGLPRRAPEPETRGHVGQIKGQAGWGLPRSVPRAWEEGARHVGSPEKGPRAPDQGTGGVGVSQEVSPEPRTRGHTVWGLPRRVLEPGRKDSWGGVSREGSWSAGTVDMQGGVSREGSRVLRVLWAGSVGGMGGSAPGPPAEKQLARCRPVFSAAGWAAQLCGLPGVCVCECCPAGVPGKGCVSPVCRG